MVRGAAPVGSGGRERAVQPKPPQAKQSLRDRRIGWGRLRNSAKSPEGLLPQDRRLERANSIVKRCGVYVVVRPQLGRRRTKIEKAK